MCAQMARRSRLHTSLGGNDEMGTKMNTFLISHGFVFTIFLLVKYFILLDESVRMP